MGFAVKREVSFIACFCISVSFFFSFLTIRKFRFVLDVKLLLLPTKLLFVLDANLTKLEFISNNCF